MCAIRSGNRKLWTKFVESGECPRTKWSVCAQKMSKIGPAISSFRGRILGIDPSLRGTGLAVIEVKSRDKIDLIFSQTVKISARDPLLTCTLRIFEAVTAAIERYYPAICAAEQTIYVQNFQTAQRMGIARGAVLTAIASRCLSVYEYAPLRIKQAICGYGRASKEQISAMVQAILKIQMDVSFDETDAAAAAICCFFTERSLPKINLDEENYKQRKE